MPIRYHSKSIVIVGNKKLPLEAGYAGFYRRLQDGPKLLINDHRYEMGSGSLRGAKVAVIDIDPTKNIHEQLDAWTKDLAYSGLSDTAQILVSTPDPACIKEILSFPGYTFAHKDILVGEIPTSGRGFDQAVAPQDKDYKFYQAVTHAAYSEKVEAPVPENPEVVFVLGYAQPGERTLLEILVDAAPAADFEESDEDEDSDEEETDIPYEEEYINGTHLIIAETNDYPTEEEMAEVLPEASSVILKVDARYSTKGIEQTLTKGFEALRRHWPARYTPIQVVITHADDTPAERLVKAKNTVLSYPDYRIQAHNVTTCSLSTGKNVRAAFEKVANNIAYITPEPVKAPEPESAVQTRQVVVLGHSKVGERNLSEIFMGRKSAALSEGPDFFSKQVDDVKMTLWESHGDTRPDDYKTLLPTADMIVIKVDARDSAAEIQKNLETWLNVLEKQVDLSQAQIQVAITHLDGPGSLEQILAATVAVRSIPSIKIEPEAITVCSLSSGRGVKDLFNLMTEPVLAEDLAATTESQAGKGIFSGIGRSVANRLTKIGNWLRNSLLGRLVSKLFQSSTETALPQQTEQPKPHEYGKDLPDFSDSSHIPKLTSTLDYLYRDDDTELETFWKDFDASNEEETGDSGPPTPKH